MKEITIGNAHKITIIRVGDHTDKGLSVIKIDYSEDSPLYTNTIKGMLSLKRKLDKEIDITLSDESVIKIENIYILSFAL